MHHAEPSYPAQGSILIVDDHELTRRLLREWLAERFPRARIDAVDSGEAALERASTQAHDVVLMDVHLPGINGIETTRRLYALNPGLRVIIMTNHDLAHYQQAAEAVGACGFVPKRTMHRELLPMLAPMLHSALGVA